MKAYLVLEDNTIYEGRSIGKEGTTFGEIVFNTSMTGYQEMLTDPSYKGQILTFTYPLIGNYGINEDDFESDKVMVEGIIAREISSIPSNWRSVKSFDEYLKENKIVGICGIDTRALTKHLRTKGVMMGIISIEKSPEKIKEMFKELPNYGEVDFVKEVSTKKIYKWEGKENFFNGKNLVSISQNKKYNVVLIDLGVKNNILRLLSNYECEIQVLPCTAKKEEILFYNPDGIVFSPGPGDPARLDYVIRTMKELVNLNIPIMGICLGHQLLAWAFEGKTYKLKFGHRGANHPVKELNSGRCFITSQNHGYAVDEKSIENSGLKITHINLNDGTVEGMEHKELPIFSIQYHPEASPGPMDSRFLFEKFIEKIEKEINAKKR